MRKLKLYALMITTALLAGLAVVWGVLTFLVLIIGDCGVTVFDSPDWPLQLFIVSAVPSALVFVAVIVWRYCARRLPFSSLR
jgi:hypothetical protein